MAEFLSVEEAGRVLGVSVSTVWRRIRAGEVESVLRAGRRLIPSGSLSMHPRGRDSSQVPAFDDTHGIFSLAGAGRGGGRPPGAREKHSILDGRR